MSRIRLLSALASLLLFATACAEPERQPAPPAAMHDDSPRDPDAPKPADADPTAAATTQLATFGGGCFWCTEAVLEQLDGVIDVTSGYTGGHVDDPTYQQVCSGETGHAEVVQVTFDPKKIGYEALLDWFFRSHDPTTLNRQGADVGTQYRSAIFTHSDAQRQVAEKLIARIQPNFGSKIVTEVTPIGAFWPAEKYHQNYFRNNSNQRYCELVIKPKLKKLDLDSEPGK